MDNNSNLTPPIQPVTPRRNPLYTVIIVIVAIAVIWAIWYYQMDGSATNRTSTNDTALVASPAASPSTDAAAIESDADLKAAEDGIDTIDMKPIDMTLTENDTDASAF